VFGVSLFYSILSRYLTSILTKILVRSLGYDSPIYPIIYMKEEGRIAIL
jgi:hypothetical protein